MSDDPEALEEERRLCYVGITRAREELMLTAARQRMVKGETRFSIPSRFLKEIPEELTDEEMQEDSVSGRQGEKSRTLMTVPCPGGMRMGNPPKAMRSVLPASACSVPGRKATEAGRRQERALIRRTRLKHRGSRLSESRFP